MNSNFLIIFSFQQNKWYLNAHKEDEESINYQTRETKKNEVQVVGENEIDDKSK